MHIDFEDRQASEAAERQSGAVLPLCLLFGFVLLLMGGLAIDSIMFGSSRAQHQHTAEYVALAALREYGSPPPSNAVAQLTAARNRAQEIAGVNIFLSKPFQNNGAYSEELGTGTTAGGMTVDGATGRIQPGVWHSNPEFVAGVCQGASPCPCDSAGDWAGPCFEGLDFSNVADRERAVNAFRAELWLKDGSPVRTLFAKLTGQNAWTFSSRATATVKPTHGVFLVDLSKSSHYETHLPWERSGAGSAGLNPATQSAFRISNKSCPSDESMPCATVASSTDYTCGLPPAARTPTDCRMVGGWQDRFDNAIFNFDCPDLMPRTRPASFSKTRHAKLDYRCYAVDSFDDDGVSVSGLNYLVDAYRGTLSSGVLYDGPEPLTSMLSTINYATTQMSSRNVPGDMLSLIGVDQSARIDIRTFPLALAGTTTFTDMQDVTNIAVDSSTLARLTKRNKEHFFFPRENAGFNLREGLEAAVEQLDAAPDLANSEAFIAVITDGVVSCSTGSVSSCSEIDAAHIEALIDASNDFVQSELVPRKIKFHLLLNGDISRVSTIVRKGNSDSTESRCMTEGESRESGLDFVNYEVSNGGLSPLDALTKRPPSAFYPYPMKLYQSVRATGGVYGPIRPPCLATLAPSGGPSCAEGGIEKLLDATCANGSLAQGAAVGAIPGLVDAYGRLTCDPRCRDSRTQGRAYVDKIFERSPYVLVE